MFLESILAFLHFSAILMMVVFVTSEAALCRAEWLNADVLKRLARLDVLYGISALCVLLTGLARMIWGAKGFDWYLAQPMLHAKLTFFVLIALISIPASIALRRWVRIWNRTGQLPLGVEVRKVRRLIMIGSHLMLLIPLFAVFLARGVFSVPVS
ncbi:MAG: DUF2214 family protein [Lautropia sp.]|nr:DUF2214 family protein [Lautropia sp.]